MICVIESTASYTYWPPNLSINQLSVLPLGFFSTSENRPGAPELTQGFPLGKIKTELYDIIINIRMHFCVILGLLIFVKKNMTEKFSEKKNQISSAGDEILSMI